MTSFKTVAVDGLDIFYREAGPQDAPVVLLLHGFPTSSHMFRNLMPMLAQQFRVIAPDLPGFGFSAAPGRGQFTYSFANLARVIDRFTEVVGLERYALYIFDYGAPVGLRLALAHPERITALVSQNGNAYEEGLSAGWNPIQRYWQEPTLENRTALRDFLKAETTVFQYTYGVTDPSLVAPEAYTLDSARLDRPGNDEIQLDLFLDYQSNVALYPAFQEYFRTHRPPTLAVWGKNDPFFLPPGAEAFKRDIPAAQVEFFETGHFALETHVREIGTSIRNFLNQTLNTTSKNLFADVTAATAPTEAQPLLAGITSAFGYLPNLAVAMATEPKALAAYIQLLTAFGETSLTAVEQQIVLMVASYANEAEYGAQVHAGVARQLGVSAEVLAAIKAGQPIADPKLAALQRFTHALTVGRGQVSDADTQAILAAGYDRQALVAITLGVAAKTFANGIALLVQPAMEPSFTAG